jgi:hypothetical protein
MVRQGVVHEDEPRFQRIILPNGQYSNSNQGLNGRVEFTPSTNFRMIVSQQQLQSSAGRFTVDTVGFAGRVSLLDFGATQFFSRSTVSPRSQGFTSGVGIHFRNIAARSDLFKSPGAAGILTSSLTERIGFRWALTQYLTRSAGKTSLQFGGSYHTNRFGGLAASVGYSTVYDPSNPRQPFQKSLTLTVGIRVPHASTMTGSLTRAAGQIQHSLAADTYFLSNSATTVRHGSMDGMDGKYVVSLSAKNEQGVGIDGVAVQAGSQTCVTDTEGSCVLRFKKNKIVNLTVLPDFFSGSALPYVRFDAPITVKPEAGAPGRPVLIMVRRK